MRSRRVLEFHPIMLVMQSDLSRCSVCLALSLISIAAFSGSAAAQGSGAPECREPQACRELALEARARGAYENFHDLAWRAVQTGPPNDPDLMYLLARAQALSGRRRDALVMLRRLAEAGFLNDAATEEDFRRVRELPEWQGVVAIASRARPADPAAARAAQTTTAPPAAAAAAAVTAPPAVARPAATAAAAPPPATPRPSAPATRSSAAVSTPAAPSTAAAPVAAAAPAVAAAPAAAAPPPAVAAPAVPVAPSPSAAVRSALRIEPAIVDDAVRFSTATFTPGGLAYDAVSRRFLFGDLAGRRLFVVGEGSDRTIDLARAESAGFDDVTAIAIDPKRGDLWVATTSADGSSGTVHHLQLISGRVLARFSAPGVAAMRLSDVAVTGDGTVLVLDSAAPRVLVLRPGATKLELLMTLKTSDPVSIAAADDGGSAFIAHRDGIARLDFASRRATPLNAAKGIALEGFEFIRLRRDVLLGSQIQPDGSRGLVRLRLNREHRSVTGASLIDASVSREEGPKLATISGDDLYYLVTGQTEGPGGQPELNVRVRRIRLP